MSERQPTTEEFLKLSQMTRRYVTEDILWDPRYNEAIAHVGSSFGAQQNPEVHMGIALALQQGIVMAETRINQLAIFRDPESRRQMLERIERGELDGTWLLRMADWNMQEDPHGFKILEECKRKDVEEIISQAGQAEDELEEIRKYRSQAEAIRRGQDLVIESDTKPS